MANFCGFLNLNKPAGLTSHDCVARVRRLLKMKRVGHGGTLDPAATGVLPIALDRATRLLQFLPDGKAYRATVRFGLQTTTDDLEGEVIAAHAVPHLDLPQVQAALPQFVGQIQQVPPMYSAIQVQGQRLYNLARAGETIEVPVRSVVVSRIEILAWRSGDFPEIDLEIACGPGTYIRAIARDLGEVLQTGGTLAKLERTESCGFQLADSLTLEDLEIRLPQEIWQPLPPDAALRHLPAIDLPVPAAQRWCQGQSIPWSPGMDLSKAMIRVYHGDDRFLGIGQWVQVDETELLAPRIVFDNNL